jgi:hypothetical protein
MTSCNGILYMNLTQPTQRSLAVAGIAIFTIVAVPSAKNSSGTAGVLLFFRSSDRPPPGILRKTMPRSRQARVDRFRTPLFGRPPHDGDQPSELHHYAWPTTSANLMPTLAPRISVAAARPRPFARHVADMPVTLAPILISFLRRLAATTAQSPWTAGILILIAQQWAPAPASRAGSGY